MEPLHTKHTWQAFFLKLRIIPLGLGQRSRHISDWSLSTIGILCASTAPMPTSEASHARIKGNVGSKWTRRDEEVTPWSTERLSPPPLTTSSEHLYGVNGTEGQEPMTGLGGICCSTTTVLRRTWALSDFEVWEPSQLLPLSLQEGVAHLHPLCVQEM